MFINKIFTRPYPFLYSLIFILPFVPFQFLYSFFSYNPFLSTHLFLSFTLLHSRHLLPFIQVFYSHLFIYLFFSLLCFPFLNFDIVSLLPSFHPLNNFGYLYYFQIFYTVSFLLPLSSVSDPDPVGSGFKSPVWIRIRIRDPDPDPAIEIELF